MAVVIDRFQNHTLGCQMSHTGKYNYRAQGVPVTAFAMDNKYKIYFSVCSEYSLEHSDMNRLLIADSEFLWPTCPAFYLSTPFSSLSLGHIGLAQVLQKGYQEVATC